MRPAPTHNHRTVGSIAVFSFLLFFSANALADHKYFSTTAVPPWESFPRNDTWAVAVGDVDMDGDLDVVFGNSSVGATQWNTLYLSTDGRLERDPAWESDRSFDTHAVALGDVDGDGDLDLVCGNLGGPNTLYLNVGGALVFETTPVWESDPRVPVPVPLYWLTRSVMLADVNGDGRLDLVCGNGAPLKPQSNTVYLNVGGEFVFEKTPSWKSFPAKDTRSVALGDLDGNGALDLVCGNMGSSGDSNTVYLNLGNGLDTIPAWASAATNRTASVAIGDINGDGLLDLACGNGGEFQTDSNAVYLNLGMTGSVFETVPSWQSAQIGKTVSVALGDVDEDGDLDLVCGNVNEENRLYLNNIGVLDPLSVWSSIPTRNRTRSVALGDIDGDGDVELLCANSGTLSAQEQSNALYDNEGEVFGPRPQWVSTGSEKGTHDVALGDIDGDGDLDLVCANAVEPGGVAGRLPEVNTLYLNDSPINPRVFRNPPWESADSLGHGRASSLGVALADVDLDGDLDIAFANGTLSTSFDDPSPPVTLYRGLGSEGSLPETSWTFGLPTDPPPQ